MYLNKCKKCGRPLKQNKFYCPHCKTKIGNIAGKAGTALASILSVGLIAIKKYKK